MRGLEELGHDLSAFPSTKILMSYYRYLGVSPDTSFSNWMHGVGTGKYPAYGSITRAIRAVRSNNPSWRKKRKQQQVDAVKTEVGY